MYDFSRPADELISLNRSTSQKLENKNLKFGAGYQGLTANNDDLPTQKKPAGKRQYSSDDVLILK